MKDTYTRAFNMWKTASHIGSAVLALNAVRNNESGSNDAFLHSITDLSTWAIERLRSRHKQRQGSTEATKPVLGAEEPQTESESEENSLKIYNQVAEKLNQFLKKAKCNGPSNGTCKSGAGSAQIIVNKDSKTSDFFNLVISPCTNFKNNKTIAILITKSQIDKIQSLSNNQDQEIYNVLKSILETGNISTVYDGNIIGMCEDKIILVNGERSYLKICDANNLIPSPPPELNKTFLESFATSINNNFSANNCKNIKVSYIGPKTVNCGGGIFAGTGTNCGQNFIYTLSFTINGSTTNAGQCIIPVNEMKEIQKNIINNTETDNFYINTFTKWYNYPTLKYDNNEYKIEFINNNLCCLLNPSKDPNGTQGLKPITICGSCQ